ncbi:MAG: hypothetical protein ACOC1X_02090 [Promethearchaeota archaeon]
MSDITENQTMIKDVKECLNRLRCIKDLLYPVDFKYNENIGRSPNPLKHINDAIRSLERAKFELIDMEGK